MPALPPAYPETLRTIHESLREVEGWLTHREIEFLALLAACPTASGDILEIGSFRGRSTIVLAKGAALADSAKIHAVDPLGEWGPMIPDEQGKPSARALLEKNLKQNGVREHVEVHQMLSHELGRSWKRPLRLLWIDGDHAYESAKCDFDNFSPFLADGAMIAFHDVMTFFRCGGVFLNEVVKSPHFGPVGLCGSIGWGQYFRDPRRTQPFAAQKQQLARQLEALERFDYERLQSKRLERIRFRLKRWRIEHGPIAPERWLKMVA